MDRHACRAVLRFLGLVLALALLGAPNALARDQIRIVGSAAVFPFMVEVSEEFERSTWQKTPVIEQTGTSGGVRLFCQGLGSEHPDIVMTSRRIKSSEVEFCARNGVNEISETKIGYDAVVLANAKSGPTYELTRKQIFMALAKQVPVDGKLVNNPYSRWSEIDPSLPDTEIEVLGPPPTSGTRDAFVELVMREGAERFPMLDAMEKKQFRAVFHSMREDGRFIEAGENDNLIVQKLEANPVALAIFGFSFLDHNADKVRGSTIDGVEPTYENIEYGGYPISRPLYVYFKIAHVGVFPGLQEFADVTGKKTCPSGCGPSGSCQSERLTVKQCCGKSGTCPSSFTPLSL